MVTGDGTYIKRINRSLILQKIIEYGMISRANISKITGLNKATISVQVAELLDEELIFETSQEHHSVGRKPIMLSLNQSVGYVLGIDLDYTNITYTLSDLLGTPVHTETLGLTTPDYDLILEFLKTHIKNYKNMAADARYGLVSVVIGTHGTVSNDETITFVPQNQWHDKSLKADLEKDIGTPVHIENNANLSAFAERVFKYHHRDDLLSITMYSGIGLGILMDGKLIKGFSGHAGEIGHMIIYPDGEPCKCGNNGCWELYASEMSLFTSLLQKDYPGVTYEQLQQLIDDSDPFVCEEMEKFIEHLSIGLNNVINLYNPETVVLNSEVLKIHPNAVSQIRHHLHSSVSQYRELEVSSLGREASVLGACALGAQKFLNIPEISLNLTAGEDESSV